MEKAYMKKSMNNDKSLDSLETIHEGTENLKSEKTYTDEIKNSLDGFYNPVEW